MIDTTVFANLKETVESAVSRRKFLQLSGIGTGTVLGGSLLSRLQSIAAPAVKADEGILVVVYLMGGNDPLTMLSPYNDNTYRAARPNLSLTPESNDPNRKCLPIGKIGNTDYGFHANLPTLKAKYDAGQVAVIPGVGFTNQSMSHFAVQEVYWNGWDGAQSGLRNGWAGRYLDTFSDAAVESTRSITMNGFIPTAILGSKSKPISLPKILNEAYATGTDTNRVPVNMQTGKFGTYSGNAIMNQLSESLKQTTAVPGIYGSAYPAPVANQAVEVSRLSVAAGVINANLGARVMHTQFDGFDVHTGAGTDHPARLKALDDSLNAFFTGLKPEWQDRVTVLVYSEMGRRLKENGSGTDHGLASMALLIGNKVSGGVKNNFPSLTDLNSDGNLKVSLDFRAIYGEIVDTWLGGDEQQILGKTYTRLGLFKSGPGTSVNTQPPQTDPPTQPPKTDPPQTQPPATDPPVTKPPVTQPPETKPPVTQPPATQPPATQPVTTKLPPETKPPVTQPPATQPVTTKLPPETKPPVTQPPATQPPATTPVTKPNNGNGHGRRRHLRRILKALFGG